MLTRILLDRDESGTQSDGEIFEELERDIDEYFDFGALREKRLEELKQEYVSWK